MKRLALLALALAGCQSFGAFSQPDTLPKDGFRVGAVFSDDDFQVSDEKVDTVDMGVSAAYGATDSTELDGFASTSTLEGRVKHAFLQRGTLALAASAGLGLFTAWAAHTSALYVPADVVIGLHPTNDVCLFLGPQAWAALALDSPGQGAGFNRGNFGLLAGGVAGIALEDPRLTFVPQISLLTPVGTGARGTVLQVNFGLATQVR